MDCQLQVGVGCLKIWSFANSGSLFAKLDVVHADFYFAVVSGGFAFLYWLMALGPPQGLQVLLHEPPRK